MYFNSLEFAFFLPFVFVLYWFLFNRGIKVQNAFLVVASYFFYGWWDWRFLTLVIGSTLLDFVVANALRNEREESKRKMLLWTSISFNLGLLGFFKYFNFFIESFESAFSLFGAEFGRDSIRIILPVGISFYTFQTLSYTIDVYKRKIDPSRDLVSFAAFVCFFPQLVAGPIERSTHLLPQFYQRRKLGYPAAVDGMRQILWGLFKKVVIADNCGEFANVIFNNSNEFSGASLFLGAILFAFKIYGDFSGYSDIAIGTSRLFGFNLKQNFAFPYFSRDVAEFWRRWHISLSTWFRDYLYIPIGGSKGDKLSKVRNVFIIFIASGFWHGANWTFITWGAFNAFLFLPLLLAASNKKHTRIVAEGKHLPNPKELVQMLGTFSLIALGWIFFRADDIDHASNYMKSMFMGLIGKHSYVQALNFIVWQIGFELPLMLLFFMVIEWIGRHRRYALEGIDYRSSRLARWLFYYLVLFFIFYYQGQEQQFIYFQF